MLARLIRPHSIERRLLLWLLIITLVPSLTVLAIASWAGNEAASLVGASGSWTEVARTGRALVEKVSEDPNADPELRRAAQAHAEQLSNSLTQAGRWEFVGARMRSMLPLFFLGLALMTAGIAIWAARRMARSVSRPIRELVEWSALMAKEQPLPEVTRRELGEVKELRALRGALRSASEEMAVARSRALEAERTRSWGEMARRVAHEMKNPLTPLRLASHRLQKMATSNAELDESVTVIEEETARLEQLASRFAELGRPADGPRSVVDVRDMLERLVATDVPANCETKLSSQSNQPLVMADYNALVQAFRNVVRNAVEAINSDGRIDVIISDENDSLRVDVADNGAGFDGDTLPHIFEPDFTSKRGGTGLGLAVTRQIIRAHNGNISAHHGDNGGAVIRITLPRTTETV